MYVDKGISKFLVLFFIMGFGLYACSDKEEKKNNFSIDGLVNGVSEGKLYFIHQTIEGTPIIDTVNIENGKFRYQGHIDEPTPYYISTNLLRTNNTPPTLLFLEPNKMTLDLNLDNLDAAQLKNSKSQQEYLEYKMADRPLKQKADSIYAVAFQNSEDKELTSELETQLEKLDKEESALISKFVDEHPKSVVSAYLISGKFMSKEDFGQARELYSKLDKSIQNSIIGKQMGDVLNKVAMTEIGGQAPDFTQTSIEGKQISLSDFRGKYVLLDFWASWCSPCRRENPNLLKAYSKYANDNFKILGVSLDNDKDKWVDAVRDDGLQWQQVSDLNGWQNTVAQTYGISSIPSNFLIDPKGKIIAKNLKGPELEEKLREIYNH